jgi:hypothetical protein
VHCLDSGDLTALGGCSRTSNRHCSCSGLGPAGVQETPQPRDLSQPGNALPSRYDDHTTSSEMVRDSAALHGIIVTQFTAMIS